MIPKALNGKEYQQKAWQFLKSDISPKALLKQWEIEHLEVNENFHFYLADAIDYYINQEYSLLNQILKANPKMKFEQGKKMFPIDTYQSFKAFVYQRGLSLAYQKELGFDLVEIVRPIVQNYIKYYPTTGSGFNWIEELEHYIVKCKLQFERLNRLKSELSEPTFKAKIKLEIIDLEREIEEKEEAYYKTCKPKNHSLLGLHEANKEKYPEKEQMLWYKFTNGILIDFTKKMFPEVEKPLVIEKPKVNDIKKQPKDEPINQNFDTIFISEESKLQTLEAAKKLGIINDNHNWIYGIKKKAAIMAIIDVLKTRGKLKDLPDINLANIFATKFNTTISERTTRARPKYYPDLLKDLKVLII